jgi:hypothetical protein
LRQLARGKREPFGAGVAESRGTVLVVRNGKRSKSTALMSGMRHVHKRNASDFDGEKPAGR